MNYEALIKRAEKAIETIMSKATGPSVHKVTVDDDIEKLSGLVIVMHPSFIKNKAKSSEEAV